MRHRRTYRTKHNDTGADASLQASGPAGSGPLTKPAAVARWFAGSRRARRSVLSLRLRLGSGRARRTGLLRPQRVPDYLAAVEGGGALRSDLSQAFLHTPGHANFSS